MAYTIMVDPVENGQGWKFRGWLADDDKPAPWTLKWVESELADPSSAYVFSNTVLVLIAEGRYPTDASTKEHRVLSYNEILEDEWIFSHPWLTVDEYISGREFNSLTRYEEGYSDYQNGKSMLLFFDRDYVMGYEDAAGDEDIEELDIILSSC